LNQPWTKYLPAFIRSQIEGRAYLQNVVSNTGWQFADNALRMAAGLVVGVWMARYLGPEQFGLLSYAMALVAMFGVIVTVGLDDILVRDLVRDRSQHNVALGTVFTLRLTGGLIAFLVPLAAVFYLRPHDDLSHWMVGIIAAGTFFQAFNIIEFWFYSQLQAKNSVLVKLASFFFCVVVKIVLIIAGAPLIAFALAILLECILVAVGFVVSYKIQGNRLCEWRASADRAIIYIKESWPLLLSGMLVLIYLKIDQVMLGDIVGENEVGVYSVAARLAEMWYFIPMAIFWSLFPGIVEAKSIDEKLFHQRIQQIFNIIALLSYLVILPVSLIAKWLVPVLFGEAYGRGGPMLAVLIWANLFYGMEIARSSFLIAMHWTRIYLVTVALGCVLNIMLNWILIPVYGGMGAVIASVVSYWFASHGSCFLFRSLVPIGIMMNRALLRPKFR